MEFKDLPKVLFDEKKRREFMSPERVLEQSGIEKGMKVGDLGCGEGFFTIPIADALRNDGEVYAVDILERMLKAIESQATEKGLSNIKTILADIEVLRGIKMEDNFLDVVLLSNVFFQSKERSGIVDEVRRIIKSGGKFVVIEWNMDVDIGPDKEDRLSKEDAVKLINERGFELKKEIDTGSYHYGFVFEKK